MPQSTIVSVPVIKERTIICYCNEDEYLANGEWHTDNYTFYDNSLTINGCDSIVVKNFLFNPEYVKNIDTALCEGDSYFVKEFVLWALVEYKQLSKHRFTEGVQFKDPYGSFISGI